MFVENKKPTGMVDKGLKEQLRVGEAARRYTRRLQRAYFGAA